MTLSIYLLLLVWIASMRTVEKGKTEYQYRKCYEPNSFSALCDHFYPFAVYFNVRNPKQCGTLCGLYNYSKEAPVRSDEEVNSILRTISSITETTSFYYADYSPIFMYVSSTQLWYFGESRYTTDDQIPFLFMKDNMNRGCTGFNYEEHSQICTISKQYPILKKHFESTDLLFDTLIDPIKRADLHANTHKLPLNKPSGYSCAYYQRITFPSQSCFTVPRHCGQIGLQSAEDNGVYYILIGQTTRPVYCHYSIIENRAVVGTVIQRRFVLKENFNRNWHSYEYGFGHLEEDHWLGNKYVKELTDSFSFRLSLEVVSHTDVYKYALYDRVNVVDPLYTLQIFNFSGTLGDLLRYHNNSKFSTFDEDNDVSSINCASHFEGGMFLWLADNSTRTFDHPLHGIGNFRI